MERNVEGTSDSVAVVDSVDEDEGLLVVKFGKLSLDEVKTVRKEAVVNVRDVDEMLFESDRSPVALYDVGRLAVEASEPSDEILGVREGGGEHDYAGRWVQEREAGEAHLESVTSTGHTEHMRFITH